MVQLVRISTKRNTARCEGLEPCGAGEREGEATAGSCSWLLFVGWALAERAGHVGRLRCGGGRAGGRREASAGSCSWLQTASSSLLAGFCGLGTWEDCDAGAGEREGEELPLQVVAPGCPSLGGGGARSHRLFFCGRPSTFLGGGTWHVHVAERDAVVLGVGSRGCEAVARGRETARSKQVPPEKMRRPADLNAPGTAPAAVSGACACAPTGSSGPSSGAGRRRCGASAVAGAAAPRARRPSCPNCRRPPGTSPAPPAPPPRC